MITDTEQAIKERYELKVSGARIYTADELAEIEEHQQKSPCVHLLYFGYTPTLSLAQGGIQQLRHTWLAVVGVKSARQKGGSEDKRKKASEIIDEVINNTIGWRPTKNNSPMEMADPPAPAFSDTFAYYPLAFTTTSQHRGADNAAP